MLQTKYRLVLHLIGWEDGKIFFLDQSQGEAEYKPTMLLTLAEHCSKKSRWNEIIFSMYKPRNCHFGRTKVSSWSNLCHQWVTDVGSFFKLQLTNQEMDVCIEEEMSQDLEKGFLALGKI